MTAGTGNECLDPPFPDPPRLETSGSGPLRPPGAIVRRVRQGRDYSERWKRVYWVEYFRRFSPWFLPDLFCAYRHYAFQRKDVSFLQEPLRDGLALPDHGSRLTPSPSHPKTKCGVSSTTHPW